MTIITVQQPDGETATQAEAVISQFAGVEHLPEHGHYPDYPNWGSPRRGAQQQIIDAAGGKAHRRGAYEFADGSAVQWRNGVPVALLSGWAEEQAKAPANPYGITRTDFVADARGLRDALAKMDVEYREVDIPHLVGAAGCAVLIGYTSPKTGQPVTVLTIPKRYAIDGWAEDYYYLEGVSIEDAVARGEPYWVKVVYPAVKDWPL